LGVFKWLKSRLLNYANKLVNYCKKISERNFRVNVILNTVVFHTTRLMKIIYRLVNIIWG
jgi:hypothetical protein